MIKQFFKKVLISYLIIICCIFTPTYRAYAASAGGWAFNSFNVATSVVTALKGGASASVAVAKSPISQKIAKGILGGLIASAALPLAISQLSGFALEAIDWVLDPANNAVKWKPKEGVKVGTYVVNNTYSASTAQAACELWNAAASASNGNPTVKADAEFCKLYGGRYNYNGNVGATYRFVENTNKDWRSIPIPAVADKIYDNAKTDSNSRSVVNDAVRDYVNEGSADTALDNAKTDTDATHNCGTGTHWSGSACVADTPTTPDTPFDPSSIIDAINSVFNAITNLFDAVMSIPDVINSAIDKVLDAIASITDVINIAIDKVINAIKDIIKPLVDLITSFIDWFKDKFTALYDAITNFFDWVKTEPTTTQAEPVDIQTPDMPKMESTDLNFGGQCPQNFDIDIDLFCKPVKFTLFDSSVFCQFLSDWIRIPVIFSASLVAVYILGGRRSD
jgi:hypothetical protein